MKKIFSLTALLLTSLLLISPTILAQENTFQLFVKFHSNEESEKILQQADFVTQSESAFRYQPKSERLSKAINRTEIKRITISEQISVKDAIHWFEQRKDVIYAEEVPTESLHYTPDDPDFSQIQDYLTAVGARQAWDISKGSSEIILAVVDTGTDIEHPDLAANIFQNPDEIPGDGIDNDENGLIDDVNGWDFHGSDKNPSHGNSSNTHGTHVSGLAGAVTDNAKGIASLGFNLKILPIKASNDNGGDFRFGYDGILYAIDMGADIINCSWGSVQESQTYAEIIKMASDQNVLVVASGGNTGRNQVFYPAGYPHALGVGSYDHQTNLKSDFSSFGPHIELLAPGGNNNTQLGIYSTLPENNYAVSTGTSMASPIVASLAALVKAHNPEWTSGQIRSALVQSAQTISENNQPYQGLVGEGRINAPLALSMERPYVTLTDYWYEDPSDNQDRVFNRGEVFDLHAQIQNWGFDADNIELTVTSDTDFLSVLDGNSQNTSSLNHDNNFTFESVRFEVSNSVPVNTKAQVTLTFDYGDEFETQQVIFFNLVPSDVTLSNNLLELTFGGNGRIGFTDYPSTSQGSGFLAYSTAPGDQPLYATPLLREGGLMFGNSNNRISSSVRANGSNVDDDFVLLDYFSQSYDENKNALIGKAEFTDINAGIEGVRYDIKTILSTYAFGDTDERSRFIIARYDLINGSDNTYQNFYAGLFFDFNLPLQDSGNDIVRYIESDDVVIAQPSSETQDFYVGTTIAEGIYSPWLIDNTSRESFYFGINNSSNSSDDGFTDAEKHLAMSGREAALVEKRRQIGPSDVSFVLSPQPKNLAPGDTLTFHLITGFERSEELLFSQMNNARTLIEQVLLSIDHTEHILQPVTFSISNIYPNPFNPATTVQLEFPESGNFSYKVIDVLGRTILEKRGQQISSGSHTISLNMTGFSSGTYFFVADFNGSRQVKPLTLVK
jgi:subtilisin family serine protease